MLEDACANLAIIHGCIKTGDKSVELRDEM